MQVTADFLKYLFNCAAAYIKDTHANGVDLWVRFFLFPTGSFQVLMELSRTGLGLERHRFCAFTPQRVGGVPAESNPARSHPCRPRA